MKLQSKRINDFVAYFRNKEEFEKIYEAVFEREEYKFTADRDDPLIIDCGSHIGISILYFKSLYPRARIIAFEPNPDNFELLKKNVEVNHLAKITLVNAALSDKAGNTALFGDSEEKNPWTWGDTIVPNMWGEGEGGKKTEIKTVRLSPYIGDQVDFIKIDIEGMEQTVLEEIEPKLKLVQQMVIEYHRTKTSLHTNNLETILNILRRNSFVVEIKEIKSQDLRDCFPSDFPAEEFVKTLNYAVYLFYVKKT